MSSLGDLRLLHCSRDLDVLGAQRIIGFLILITHKSARSQNPISCNQFSSPPSFPLIISSSPFKNLTLILPNYPQHKTEKNGNGRTVSQKYLQPNIISLANLSVP